MTYRGHVKHGVIVLNPPAQLPEGTEVEVRTREQLSAQATWAQADPFDHEAHVAGSVAAATNLLPPEDFSDWEK
jgi:mRNA interferase MazF